MDTPSAVSQCNLRVQLLAYHVYRAGQARNTVSHFDRRQFSEFCGRGDGEFRHVSTAIRRRDNDVAESVDNGTRQRLERLTEHICTHTHAHTHL